MSTKTQARDTILAFIDRLDAFYPDQEDCWEWMSRRHKAFGGESAITLVHDGRADEVDAEIHMLETGSYT